MISQENKLEDQRARSQPVMEELKRVNQDLGRQKAELEQQLGQTRRERDELEGRLKGGEGEWQEERKRMVAAMEAQDQHNRSNLTVIEQEMQKFMNEHKQTALNQERAIQHLSQQLEQKEQQLNQAEQAIRERESVILENQSVLKQKEE